MNAEWSEMNKTMQQQIRKRDSFSEGIETLFRLRGALMEQILQFREELSPVDFSAMPFLNGKGYHNKTIAYSLWHIFRIEDIVAHSLIADDEQIFFRGDYQKCIGSSIITTGNELVKEEIGSFSQELSLEELYHYITEVKAVSEELIRTLTYDDMKRKIPDEKRAQLKNMGVVSEDDNASWLIDYWCGKDVRGLLQMPFSRHWIMHVEACLKIRDRQIKMAGSIPKS